MLAPLLAGGADRWPKLEYVEDAHLEAGLQREIEALGMARAAREKRLAAILVDITILDEPRLAGVNEHEMMYAASLPKIAILLGAFQKAADQGKDVDPLSITMLTRMIRNSSNTAATTMLERTGFEYIADVLTYARQSWSNDVASVGAEVAASVREATKTREIFWTAKELR